MSCALGPSTARQAERFRVEEPQHTIPHQPEKVPRGQPSVMPPCRTRQISQTLRARHNWICNFWQHSTRQLAVSSAVLTAQFVRIPNNQRDMFHHRRSLLQDRPLAVSSGTRDAASTATRARSTDGVHKEPSRIRCGFERTREVPDRVHQHGRNPSDRHGGHHGGNSLDLDGIHRAVDSLRGEPVGNHFRGVLESESIKDGSGVVSGPSRMSGAQHRRHIDGTRGKSPSFGSDESAGR
jgi:hypothetical protein